MSALNSAISDADKVRLRSAEHALEMLRALL